MLRAQSIYFGTQVYFLMNLKESDAPNLNNIYILTNGILLSQVNISSLIIVIGVCYDTQFTIKSLYRIYQN